MKIAKLALIICLFALADPRSSEGQAKIAGGTKATSYPWMAAVASTTGGSLFDRQFCGGSLIAPDWILHIFSVAPPVKSR